MEVVTRSSHYTKRTAGISGCNSATPRRTKTGENAAIETGLTWNMPVNEGMDWNDVHAADGLMAVCVALKDLIRKVA